jgi:hypothetical protein
MDIFFSPLLFGASDQTCGPRRAPYRSVKYVSWLQRVILLHDRQRDKSMSDGRESSATFGNASFSADHFRQVISTRNRLHDGRSILAKFRR